MNWTCGGEVQETKHYAQTEYPINDGPDAVTKIRLAFVAHLLE